MNSLMGISYFISSNKHYLYKADGFMLYRRHVRLDDKWYTQITNRLPDSATMVSTKWIKLNGYE